MSRGLHASASSAAAPLQQGAERPLLLDDNDDDDDHDDVKTSVPDKSCIRVTVGSLPDEEELDDERPLLCWWWSLFASPKKTETLPLLPSNDRPVKRCRWRFRRSRVSRCALASALVIFVMLGVLQFVSLVCGIVLSFFPDEIDRAATHWKDRTGYEGADLLHWPTDVSRDLQPVACHSHNDYWRRVPLYSALQAGCVSVEADIWLFDQELYVGHTTSALTRSRTLRSLYLNPLLSILDRQNPITHFHPTRDRPLHGVFDTAPTQTLVLLIDFKTDGAATWPALVDQLTPLRERGYLTYFDGGKVIPGPITVVGTGNAPFDLLMANSTYRDVFFDAPLDMLADGNDDDPDTEHEFSNPLSLSKYLKPDKNAGQGQTGTPATIGPETFNATNSFYASVSFSASIGYPWRFRLTPHQIGKMRAQIRGAHRRGLKVRYWALPSWPRSLRNHLWTILVEEGVDILNVDDLRSATRGKWKVNVWDWLYFPN
ncbi:hypothetical protein ASPZODRAFT_127219 [Penicilliopsis zonata CBS 506.65]|uniref:Altered inheritance of mitochondria protein 6 n=1 Tax=Penicilliopsis zonata CBS 506.65 TaxID=1073090 RepID=A0A1L9SVW4_9EURO|nr:hypothetical protein ASPZODRAFT_127219 [Penicilliopsis zonata CBS 506.65]OJJ51193.1 hypothetical protein ASPZODRAFT_127219 [Penicilliopsis zonata CBS 506.65]